jgi:hypothetical protein
LCDFDDLEFTALQALTYEKQNRSHEINKFAKQAFDEVVKPYGYLGSTDTFYKVYSSVYKRIISEAKERNEADELLEAIAQCGFAIHQFQFHVFVLFSNKAACNRLRNKPPCWKKERTREIGTGG